jgi:predicted AAA+ superfamily ATPase
MSLYESGHATGEVPLSALLGGTPPRAPDTGMKVVDLAERVAVGGWPGLLDQPVPQALRAVRAYVDEVRRTDIQRVEGVAHDPEKVLLLMRSLARNVSTMTSLATLARDVGEPDEALAKNTVSAYHEALTRLMVVDDQPAWAPHLRSRSRVRTSPRRHFVDPSVAVATLRATPERLLQDLNLLGFLFESLVIRDLRVYAQACDAQVLHYKDNTDLEVDAVVEAADGRWAAFEVKLGSGAVDEGADNLTRFATRIDTRRCGPPGMLGVITGTGLACTRLDGIAVIPIGTLGP